MVICFSHRAGPLLSAMLTLFVLRIIASLGRGSKQNFHHTQLESRLKAVLSGSGGSQKNCAAERRLDDAAAIIAARLSARGLREAACRRRRSRHGLRWLEGASAFATRVCMEASNQPWHYQAPRSSDPRRPPLPRFRLLASWK